MGREGGRERERERERDSERERARARQREREISKPCMGLAVRDVTLDHHGQDDGVFQVGVEAADLVG